MEEPGRIPFVELDPFDESTREYFFGRERESRVIAANLAAARLTILHGPCGVGKSSLILAGLVPLLRETGRRSAIVFRDWQRSDFLAALRSACSAAIPAAERDPEAPVDELLRRISSTGVLACLLLDQFDEYLQTASGDAAEEFEAELARCVNRDDFGAAVLLSLKDEAMAGLDRLKPRIPALFRNMLRVDHLTEAAAKDAIRKPLAVYSSRYLAGRPPIEAEDALVDQVVADTKPGYLKLTTQAGSPAGMTAKGSELVEAPYLQLVMTRLFEADSASGRLRLETYRRLGCARQIVRRHFADVMEGLSRSARDCCARIFDRMVTPSGNKIAGTVEDLAAYAGSRAKVLPSVLAKLDSSRIIRGVPPSLDRPGSPRYEVFHDVLCPALSEWIRDHDQRKRRRRRAFVVLAILAASLIAASPFLRLGELRGRAEQCEMSGLQSEAEAEAGSLALLQREPHYEEAMASYREAAELYARAMDEKARSKALASASRLEPWAFLAEPKRGLVYPLRGEVIRLGRDVKESLVENDISFENTSISRHHIEIRRAGPEVEDLRSTNGTTLDAEPLFYAKGKPISDGDILVLAGQELLQFNTRRPTVSKADNAWGILVDGAGKRYSYLTERAYSIAAVPKGISLSPGRASDSAAALVLGEEGPVLTGIGEPPLFFSVNTGRALDALSLILQMNFSDTARGELRAEYDLYSVFAKHGRMLRLRTGVPAFGRLFLLPSFERPFELVPPK